MPSRIENILQAIIDGTDPSQLPQPQSRNEELLMQVLEVIEGGGLPSVTAADNGKFLQVIEGAWAASLNLDKVETVTGTDVTIVAVSNTRYMCGTLSTLSFTPSATGICDVMFTSGSSKTILTLPNTVIMPDGFEVDADTVYEINILDGVYGVVASWPT